MHIDFREARYGLLFPELIACYIHTRNTGNFAKADEFDKMAIQIHAQCMIAGWKPANANKFVNGLRARARQLREPEAPIALPPMTEAELMFLHGGATAYDEFKAERAARWH